MNKNFYLLILLALSNLINAQTRFEKGYYIDNTGNKTEGLIKNLDWKNNPTSLEFKITESDEPKELTINTVAEFGIDNASKFVRFDIDIERSKTRLSDVSISREPEFKNERLFLKELVSGTATLYKYEEADMVKFFFTSNGSPIKQLVYIPYKASYEDTRNIAGLGINDILYNETYKRQIWTFVKKENTSQRSIENLKYNEDDLTKYFLDYNGIDVKKVKASSKGKKTYFNIKPSVALNMAKVNFNYENSSVLYNDIDFDFKDTPLSFGFEFEAIMPFNNNKWSVFLEPNYMSFKSNTTEKYYSYTFERKSEIKMFQLPIGIRHYFFLNNNSKIFVNPFANAQFISKKSYVRDLETRTFDLSFGLGLGFAYKKMFCELRHYLSSNISPYVITQMNFSNTSFALKYEVFSTKKKS
ncbi:porin family protein [Flavobacterium sp. SM15]|uniref:outer membrane beta-barrel protein n=1 Tax=Flavobacterium sp. SM15 TaxID=2908005 RepID=UPI001EDA71FD|nr:outer membrane beta-barrel protein [Flavobacterium sp. SM15]MCG2611484.1 porin family protein [Flavobacterium sp. SM15]